ncbi:MAG: hypothetical protein RL726_273 [Actinomycetota bacterium]
MSFDLSFQRIVAPSAKDLYDGWTRPELLVQWFTPAPWRTTEAEVDTVPGGIFRTVMCGPDGEHNEGTGCVLEAVPGERLSWTNLMGPDFAPNELGEGDFGFTATISFQTVADGTRYSATVRHVDEAGMRAHEQMGFHDGWNAALDQLVELLRNLRG